LKTFNLSQQFWEYSWDKGGCGNNFLSLKKDIQNILDGEVQLSKGLKKGNTPPTVKENTPGYSPGKPNGNTPISTGNRLEKKSEGGILLPVNNRKQPDKLWPQHRLLIDILKHPFSTITQRYKRLKLYVKLGNKWRKDLISEKCILPKKIITGKGWITLFEVTRKGKMVLGDLGYEFKNESEGVVHKFWKHKVSEFYKAMGLDVRVEEYYVNGRPDIIVYKAGKKIALEIETGKSNYVGNVERALEAGFDEVVCVAVNRFVEDKIALVLREKGILDERVKVICVRGFD